MFRRSGFGLLVINVYKITIKASLRRCVLSFVQHFISRAFVRCGDNDVIAFRYTIINFKLSLGWIRASTINTVLSD